MKQLHKGSRVLVDWLRKVAAVDDEGIADVIERVSTNGDLIRCDDGLFYFWPSNNNGRYTATDLAVIIDELNRRNAEDAHLDEDIGC